MAVQKTVAADIAWGIPGEMGLAGDYRASPAFLEAAATNANLGAALCAGTNQGQVKVGGTTAFVGLLANPKVSADTDLGAPMNLAAGTAVECVSQTPGMWVTLTTTANMGDAVAYKADGSLAAAPASTAPTQHTLIPGARVVRYDVAAGLALVALVQLPTPKTA